MAIYQLLRRGVFEPDDVCLLAAVYEDALNIVGLVDSKDPLAELIARRVIQVAQAGERDPECLKDLAIEELQHETLQVTPERLLSQCDLFFKCGRTMQALGALNVSSDVC